MTGRSWREGWRYVLPAGALGVVLLLGRRRSGWLAVGAAGLFALFFRDPERRLNPDPGVVYPAVDGVVTGIEAPVHDQWMPDERAVRSSTFLGLQNVHVNRSPVTGEVMEMESVRGGFVPARWWPAARWAGRERRRARGAAPQGRSSSPIPSPCPDLSGR